MAGKKPEPEPKRWLGLQLFSITLSITMVAVFLAPKIGPVDSVPDWVPLVAYLTGLGTVIVVGKRLPEVALDSDISPTLRFNACLILSFAGALTLAVLGLSAILVGEGWVALLFGLTGMAGWVSLSRYARIKIESAP